MLATAWVEPGKGDPVGFLYDRVMKSGVLGACDSEVQEKFRQAPSDELRRKRTRLTLNATMEVMTYDVERIAAAIWEYDQEKGA